MRQQLLRKRERDRRQAILDQWMERKLAAEAEERRYWREMRETLDPFNWGHWRSVRAGFPFPVHAHSPSQSVPKQRLA
jgi:hypothetical protein